jgi:hypothetical protein
MARPADPVPMGDQCHDALREDIDRCDPGFHRILLRRQEEKTVGPGWVNELKMWIIYGKRFPARQQIAPGFGRPNPGVVSS